LPFDHALAVLVDGTAIAHRRQPADGALWLLSFNERRVQSLPGLRVAGFEIAVVEDDPASPQVGAHAGKHPLARSLEVAAQEALGAVASEHRGAHGPKTTTT